jgi:hypothetical protein
MRNKKKANGHVTVEWYARKTGQGADVLAT